MTLAMFKLESFTTALAGHGAKLCYDRQALEKAHADGVAEGLARQEDDQMRNLCAGMDRLARALSDDEQRRAALRSEAVTALSPIFDAILDNLAPAAESKRLEIALTEELSRLAQMATPLRAQIACGAGLRDLVERCLTESGLDNIEISEVPADRISLSLQGGHIEFAPDRIAAGIRALIAEIKEKETPWTH